MLLNHQNCLHYLIACSYHEQTFVTSLDKDLLAKLVIFKQNIFFSVFKNFIDFFKINSKNKN